MGKLTDVAIRAWIRSGERFEGRSDGDGCLNHMLEGVEGVYNRHDSFEARRRALEAWGQLLMKLERGDATAKTGKAKAA